MKENLTRLGNTKGLYTKLMIASSSSAGKKADKTKLSSKATDQSLAVQEQQELLIAKIKIRLNLHRLIQAENTGILLEIDEPIKQITKKIRNLDKVQLKALEQSFDYLNNPTNFSNKGEIKLTPTALPLLPLGVEVMHLIFGATAGAYLIWKAATETAEKLQEHKKTTADSKTKDQNASSFQAHPTEPNIFVTPTADIDPTKTVFPMDQTNPSPHVFVPADVDSKIEVYPDQSSEFNRPTLLFSKRQDADENRYGGGKNAAHANRDARNAARERLNAAKDEFKRLNQLPPSKELSEQKDNLKKQIKHYQSKLNFTGENHSQRPKGGNR